MDHGVPDQNVAVYGEDEEQYKGHYGAEEGNCVSIDNINDSAGLKISSSAGKLFVGGIAWDTSEDSFNRYFSKYEEIRYSMIIVDKISGRPRGFGFVIFTDPEVADKVLEEEHVIDGRTVEVKRSVPKEGRGVTNSRKIFVGGLPLSLNEDDLRDYFSSYGNIVEHQIMLDHRTNRSRGFGFVTFETEDAVEKILSDGRMHELNGKQVEIKKAEPKGQGFDNSNVGRFHTGSSSSRSSGNFSGGSEGFGGVYGGYGSYGNFPGSYAGETLGFYGGYGGYGYGGPMYGGGGAYGSGGFATPSGYGGGGYGVSSGYGGQGGRYDGGRGFGGSSNRGADGSGGYAGGKGTGPTSTGDRFHPYRR